MNLTRSEVEHELGTSPIKNYGIRGPTPPRSMASEQLRGVHTSICRTAFLSRMTVRAVVSLFRRRFWRALPRAY